MENSYKLKIKIGEHEFEAEGPADAVREQFAAFRDLVANLPSPQVQREAQPQLLKGWTEEVGIMPPSKQDLPVNDASLAKIMKVDNRIVSLTARPDSPEAAVLLILYGQKVLRENDAVTGGEVISGLTTTGGIGVTRVDRLLERAARDGDVIVIGEHRGKRYRLTNQGLTKARAFAAELIAIVA